MAAVRLAIACLVLPVTATACAHYHARPIDHATSDRYFSRRTLADPALGEFVRQYSKQAPAGWPPAAWDLSQLTLAALYFHPDLDVSRAQWAVAAAGRKTSSQYPNPTVEVTPGYDTTTRTPSPWIVTSFLSVAIEMPGKRSARRARADALANAARLKIAAVAWEVRDRVRSSLEEVRAADAELELLRQRLALHEENAKRVEQRHAAGAASAFEQLQAKLAAQDTRLRVHDAERRAREARLALATAVGVTPEALEQVSLSFDELANPIPQAALAGARAQALMSRADLLAALADYAASEADLRLEIAKQYPEFRVGLGYEYDQGDNKWSLGLLDLTLPVLNRNKGPIAEARARRAESAARFDALQLRVIDSVARARVAYESALEKKTDTEAIRADAEAQVERAEAMQTAGDISKADVVAVRLELNAALLADESATSELHQAQGALETAVQRPLSLAPAAWEAPPRRASREGD